MRQPKPMTLKREDEIRVALADNEIPADVDGDWQDFASELLAELDRKCAIIAKIAGLVPCDDGGGFFVAAEVRALAAQAMAPHNVAKGA